MTSLSRKEICVQSDGCRQDLLFWGQRYFSHVMYSVADYTKRTDAATHSQLLKVAQSETNVTFSVHP